MRRSILLIIVFSAFVLILEGCPTSPSSSSTSSSSSSSTSGAPVSTGAMQDMSTNMLNAVTPAVSDAMSQAMELKSISLYRDTLVATVNYTNTYYWMTGQLYTNTNSTTIDVTITFTNYTSGPVTIYSGSAGLGMTLTGLNPNYTSFNATYNGSNFDILYQNTPYTFGWKFTINANLTNGVESVSGTIYIDNYSYSYSTNVIM